jgi:single-strand DNA-binding protein
LSGTINKVILVANVVADPEIRRDQSGRAIVNLRVATSEYWRSKETGERKERSEFHRVVVFNDGLAKVCEQYVRKGSKLYIEGQLQTREWEKDGGKRYSTEIVLQGFNSALTMLDAPKRGDDAVPMSMNLRRERAPEPDFDDGDEVPF